MAAMNTPKPARLHCSLLTTPADLTTAHRLQLIVEAGFDGVQTHPPESRDLARFRTAVDASGLEVSGCGHLAENAPAEPLFARAAAAGMVSLNAQVDGYWRDDAWQDDRVEELLVLSRDYGLPFYLETHRHRMTQDLQRTVSLVRRHPELLLCGDFSHWVVMGELRAPWPPEWRTALHALARRCGEIHLRLNDGQSVQSPLAMISAGQREEFWSLWQTAAAANPDLCATTELLPADIGYDQVDLDGRPISDIWKDSVDLLAEARLRLAGTGWER
jgi:sugar phosphate isomerase/epimerase